jgi:hypothetical protein
MMVWVCCNTWAWTSAAWFSHQLLKISIDGRGHSSENLLKIILGAELTEVLFLCTH